MTLIFCLRRKRPTAAASTTMVDVKTGKAVPYPDMDMSQLQPSTNISGGINITFSPNKKWAAYTKKDNNLYLYDVVAAKENQLTTDGSSTILNSYSAGFIMKRSSAVLPSIKRSGGVATANTFVLCISTNRRFRYSLFMSLMASAAIWKTPAILRLVIKTPRLKLVSPPLNPAT